MKQSRAILREHLPAMAKAVGNCETEAQKRGYLAEVRDEVSENAYWAWCYEHPGDVLGGVGEVSLVILISFGVRSWGVKGSWLDLSSSVCD